MGRLQFREMQIRAAREVRNRAFVAAYRAGQRDAVSAYFEDQRTKGMADRCIKCGRSGHLRLGRSPRFIHKYGVKHGRTVPLESCLLTKDEARALDNLVRRG